MKRVTPKQEKSLLQKYREERLRATIPEVAWSLTFIIAKLRDNGDSDSGLRVVRGAVEKQLKQLQAKEKNSVAIKVLEKFLQETDSQWLTITFLK